ncbi:hypothetical protein PoB_006785200 [Plakobranchus ocellatus]|uniref:Uncharacterized protein n=1 Tax=Plakobranchus ocellatus TaxID=259542 RepID=A0AAV4DBF1_9GAST|nr:hypothetical protein PoB_006785200 [Plakobranchus ocellatus]
MLLPVWDLRKECAPSFLPPVGKGDQDRLSPIICFSSVHRQHALSSIPTSFPALSSRLLLLLLSSISFSSHMKSGIELTHHTVQVSSHTSCWEYSFRVALAQHRRSAKRVPLFGHRGGRRALELERTAKVADRSPLKIHRELKSILSDETILVTKLGSGDPMVELRSKDQSKKLRAIATFLDIPVTVSPHESLNSSKGVIRSRVARRRRWWKS